MQHVAELAARDAKHAAELSALQKDLATNRPQARPSQTSKHASARAEGTIQTNASDSRLLSGGALPACGDVFLNGDLFIPSGVTEIPASQYFNCTLLRTVHIPATVVNISSKAFGPGVHKILFDVGFSGITQPDAFDPSTLEACGERPRMSSYAVRLPTCNDVCPGTPPDSSCAGREDGFLMIPRGVVNISAYQYAGCEELKTIQIASTVQNIEKFAFKYSGLRMAYYEKSFEGRIEADAFFKNTRSVCGARYPY